MKRGQKPKQHFRKIRTRVGIRKILVNAGLFSKKKKPEQPTISSMSSLLFRAPSDTLPFSERKRIRFAQYQRDISQPGMNFKLVEIARKQYKADIEMMDAKEKVKKQPQIKLSEGRPWGW